MKHACWIGLTLLLCCPLAQAEAPAAGSSKAVLVTGASTGIGRMITERLAADGYFVYARAQALVRMLDEALATARPAVPAAAP